MGPSTWKLIARLSTILKPLGLGSERRGRAPDELVIEPMDRRWEEIRRSIRRKLLRQFRGPGHARSNVLGKSLQAEEANTNRFDRVLALWIDLQRAVLLRGHHIKRPTGCTPWECPDQSVREAWENLTEPDNALALEELFCQLPDDRQAELAGKALRACRERQDEQ
jgi:hypothetical protein